MTSTTEKYLSRVFVDKKEALHLKDIFKFDPIHQMGHNILLNSLFSQGLDMKGEDIIEDGISKHYFIKNKFEPFLKECIKPLYTFGYVVWKTITHVDKDFKGRKVEYPVVVPREMYDIEIVINKFMKCKYLIYPKSFKANRSEKPDSKYKIFIMPTKGPNRVTGDHESIVAIAVKHSEWINERFKDFSNAVRQRSHPPVVMERHKDSTKGDHNLSLIQYADNLVDPELKDKNKNDTYELVNQERLLQGVHSQNKPHDSNASTPYHEDVHGVERQKQKFYPTIVDNKYYVPFGFTVSSTQPPLPDPQKDLLNYEFNRREDILGLWGVPSSLVLSGARQGNALSSQNAIDDNDFLAFSRTLASSQKLLVELITDVYKNIEEINGKSDIEFELPIIPFVSSNSLYNLYNLDIIDKKTMQKYALSINGLRKEDAAKKPNKHERPIPGQNENFITDLIEAKKRRMLAEADLAEEKKKSIPKELAIENKKVNIDKQKATTQTTSSSSSSS